MCIDVDGLWCDFFYEGFDFVLDIYFGVKKDGCVFFVDIGWKVLDGFIDEFCVDVVYELI